MRFSFIIMALLACGAPISAALAQPVSETGLPLPRFAALKSNEVNMRAGPGKRYPLRSTYHRAGLPVKIINEYELWRQIEDVDGQQGWIHHSMLSGKRTALVTENEVLMRDKPNEKSDITAKLMKGVIVSIESCRPEWCEITAPNDTEGWVPSSLLWGAKEN